MLLSFESEIDDKIKLCILQEKVSELKEMITKLETVIKNLDKKIDVAARLAHDLYHDLDSESYQRS